jgi:hypothetical protein
MVNTTGSGTLLAVLLISGNYVSELLPCEIQKKMTESRMVKYALLLFSIWYFISGGGVDASLWTVLAMVGAFALVLILAKTHWPVFVSIFTLLFIGDVLMKLGLETMSLVCNILAVVVLIVGFIAYLREQRIEHTAGADSFSWNRFWFSNDCARMKDESTVDVHDGSVL